MKTLKLASSRALLLLVGACFTSTTTLGAADVTVAAPDSPTIQFALNRLEHALKARGDSMSRRSPSGPASIQVLHRQAESGSNPADDGYRLERVQGPAGSVVRITAQGQRGAMYGLLDLTEQIRGGTALDEVREHHVTPAFAFRAIKFNLPWAAYRTSPAIEQHDQTCRDLAFWEAFLDMMAENRFNVLTLWSLHPYTYMIRPKSFPEACPFTDAELADWKRLWKGILRLAKERGIETYLLNWNIFVSPEFARAHDVARWSETLSHYGQESTRSELVVRYTREVVRQVLEEYPDLTGLGITLGERMGGMTPDERREWLDQTFFAAMAEAGRPVKFIYRAPLSATTHSGGTTSEENDRRSRAQIEALARLTNVTPPVFVEFKHNWSHAHSSPDLFIVHGGPLSDAYWNPPPTRHQVVWTMRNEDMFILRWGEPDFVRAFLQRQQGRNYVGGAIIGSECYVPALDYITAPGAHQDWRWAFERQWLFYAVWGRLLYDSSTPDAGFERLLAERFGKDRGPDLLAAWKLASRVPLHLASFHRGTWDGSLYTEGFSSWIDNATRKLIDIEKFISHPVLDTRRHVNIAGFVKTGRVPEGALSPLDLAEQLDRDRAAALKLVTKLRQQGGVTPRLDCELTDIEAWCAYSDYFAAKLRGGVALATARANQDAAQQQRAVAELEKARSHWKRLADLGSRFNQLPVPSSAEKPFSWSALLPEVEQDIELAKKPLPNQ